MVGKKGEPNIFPKLVGFMVIFILWYEVRYHISYGDWVVLWCFMVFFIPAMVESLKHQLHLCGRRCNPWCSTRTCQLSNEENLLTFPCTGCSGVLKVVYYNPHITRYNPLYTRNNQKLFFHCLAQSWPKNPLILLLNQVESFNDPRTMSPSKLVIMLVCKTPKLGWWVYPNISYEI